VPTKRRRLSMRNVCEYHDNTCAYTGKKLTKHTRSLDHVIPKSKGGKTTWDNVVPCDRELNSLKANRTPKEAGLQLRVVPQEPRRVPFTEILKKREISYPEWRIFIKAA
jgi:5-methylcytosine-specific restriction endonuclease McrA